MTCKSSMQKVGEVTFCTYLAKRVKLKSFIKKLTLFSCFRFHSWTGGESHVNEANCYNSNLKATGNIRNWEIPYEIANGNNSILKLILTKTNKHMSRARSVDEKADYIQL